LLLYSKVSPPFSNFNEGGRYATLVAVVGITTKKEEFNEYGYKVDEDDDDNAKEEDFLDYMDVCTIDGVDDDNTNNVHTSNNGNDDFIVPLSSSVRLVGVGRAVLRKFFYRTPTDLCADDIEEDINDDDDGEMDYYKEEKNDDEEDEDEFIDLNFSNGGYDDNTPIVMSQFEPLVDDSSIYSHADPDRVGEKGQRSYRSSRVHGKCKCKSECKTNIKHGV
jgi:hypothetical protein